MAPNTAMHLRASKKCPEMSGPRSAGMPARHSSSEQLEHACTQLPYDLLLCLAHDVLLCLLHDEKGKMCFVTIITCPNKPICIYLILKSSTI